MLILDNTPQANSHAGCCVPFRSRKVACGLESTRRSTSRRAEAGWGREEGRMPDTLREGEAAPRKYLAAHPRLWTGCRWGGDARRPEPRGL